MAWGRVAEPKAAFRSAVAWSFPGKFTADWLGKHKVEEAFSRGAWRCPRRAGAGVAALRGLGGVLSRSVARGSQGETCPGPAPLAHGTGPGGRVRRPVSGHWHQDVLSPRRPHGTGDTCGCIPGRDGQGFRSCGLRWGPRGARRRAQAGATSGVAVRHRGQGVRCGTSEPASTPEPPDGRPGPALQEGGQGRSLDLPLPRAPAGPTGGQARERRVTPLSFDDVFSVTFCCVLGFTLGAGSQGNSEEVR